MIPFWESIFTLSAFCFTLLQMWESILQILTFSTLPATILSIHTKYHKTVSYELQLDTIAQQQCTRFLLIILPSFEVMRSFYKITPLSK